MSLLKGIFKRNSSSLVLLGGNTGTGAHADTIYKKIVDLAGGEKGKIGVITSANKPYDLDCKENGDSTDGGCNDPDAKNSKMAANRYIKRFTQYGMEAEWIPIDLANKELANDQKLTQRIIKGEFTGFFFGGGKQTDHLDSLYQGDKGAKVESKVLEAIRKQFKSGELVIAGTSAGAVVQSSEIMIVSGRSNRAMLEGALEGDIVSGSKLHYMKNEGLGFFNFGIIDSHFSQRGREGRIIRLATDTGVTMTYGIDEATALLVTNANKQSAKIEAIGQNGVQIFDLKGAKAKLNKKGLWSISNVKSTYLTEGDAYIPKTERVIFSSDKKNLKNQETNKEKLKPSKDIFSSRKSAKNEFINTAHQLVNTVNSNKAYGYPRTKDIKYKVIFNQTEETEAYFEDKNDKRMISYTGLNITIRPKRK